MARHRAFSWFVYGGWRHLFYLVWCPHTHGPTGQGGRVVPVHKCTPAPCPWCWSCSVGSVEQLQHHGHGAGVHLCAGAVPSPRRRPAGHWCVGTPHKGSGGIVTVHGHTLAPCLWCWSCSGGLYRACRFDFAAIGGLIQSWEVIPTREQLQSASGATWGGWCMGFC